MKIAVPIGTLLLVAVAAAGIALGNARPSGAGLNNALSIDADTGTSGVQSSFDFGTNPIVVRITTESITTPYAGYQWIIQWGDDVLDFGASTEIAPAPLTTCVDLSATTPTDLGSLEQLGTGGCVSAGAATSFAGPVTELEFICHDATVVSSTTIHLLATTPPEDGSTLLQTGGGVISTTLVDATVTCGAGSTATPTETNTPLPTNTPPAAPTPCDGPCPTAIPTNTKIPTATIQPLRSVTPTAKATSGTATAPAGTTPGAGTTPAAPAPTSPSGTTGAGGRGPVRLPDTGSGGQADPDGLAFSMLLAAGALVAAASGGIILRRRNLGARGR